MRSLIFLLLTSVAYGQGIKDLSSDKPVTFDEIGHKCFAAVFYASWCVACSGMMKALKHDKVGTKPICPISVDPGKDEALSYFKGKTEIQDLVPNAYLDKDGEFASSLKLPGVPLTVLFDDQGKIKEKIFGKK